MKMSSRLRIYPIARLRNSRQRGYILITLMLFLSLLAIAALAVLPDIAFQIKRDREEELIHRALGYSRGIRRYYKKFGRYPTRIEELENTNNLRFLRKRYKDPVNRDPATGQERDFKILRMGDAQLPGLQMLGQIAGPGLQGQLGGPTVPGGGVQPRSVFGSNPTQPTGQQMQVTNTDTTNQGGDSGTPPGGQTNPDSPGSSSSSDSGNNSSSGGPPQTFGGGPMLGVVSTSKAKTIREFNNKNHYKDWLFIYDPNSDRGGMLNTPVQPSLNRGFGGNPSQPAGGQVPPNTGAPGTVPPTQNPSNPGGEMPPEQ
jgi:type II secretory pathway pseudopilin PulG